MTDTIMNNRLIEVAFPLKQTSLDSVHEKNVRHGHISTLHIWPARRPLAACRAALIATLLPDPGNAEERNYRTAKLRRRLLKRRLVASCTGVESPALTSVGFVRRSAKLMVAEHPRYLIPLPVAAPF